jgi:hypothetical protein
LDCLIIWDGGSIIHQAMVFLEKFLKGGIFGFYNFRVVTHCPNINAGGYKMQPCLLKYLRIFIYGDFYLRSCHSCPSRKMDLQRRTFYLRRRSDIARLLKCIYRGWPLKRSVSENRGHFWRRSFSKVDLLRGPYQKKKVQDPKGPRSPLSVPTHTLYI